MKKTSKRNFWLPALLAVVLAYTHGSSAQEAPKSGKRAFFYSLLVPGLGQRYAGSPGSARYFVAAEALLFGCAAGHEVYSNWLEEDYRTFAAVHAGLNPEGKDKRYYVEIARYNSIYIYNEKMRVSREFAMVIPETPGNIWVWDSDENRLKYHFRRMDADRIHNRTIYFYTGIVLNHIISGIHAAILVRRHNEHTAPGNWNMRYVSAADPSNPGFAVRLTYSF